jgi:hypothetical protein
VTIFSCKQLFHFSLASPMSRRLDQLVFTKLSSGTSWPTFIGLNEGQTSKQELLDYMSWLCKEPYDLRPIRLFGSKGAHVRPIQAFEAFFSFRSSLGPVEEVVDVCVFFDGRKLWGGSNCVIGFSLADLGLPMSESWLSFLPFAIYQEESPENGETKLSKQREQLSDLLKQADVANDFKEIQACSWETSRFDNNGAFAGRSVARARLLIVVDWMALILLFNDVSVPNSTVPTAKLCPFCGFTARDKVGGWRSQSDPWMYCERRRDQFVELITSISTNLVIYDPMHGIARLFSNFWVILRSACSFREIVILNRHMKKHFRKTSGALSIKDFKAYFKANGAIQLVRQLGSLPALHPIIVRTGPKPEDEAIMPFYISVERALKALSTFYEYCYHETRSLADQNSLKDARHELVSFWYSLAGNMNPADHYMLNHFFEDVSMMFPRPPRAWLNEKEEAANSHHRRMASATLKGASQTLSQMDSYQVLLRYCILIFRIQMNSLL